MDATPRNMSVRTEEIKRGYIALNEELGKYKAVIGSLIPTPLFEWQVHEMACEHWLLEHIVWGLY